MSEVKLNAVSMMPVKNRNYQRRLKKKIDRQNKENFPILVLKLVSFYLDLPTIGICHRVSRAWNHTLDEEDIWISLFPRTFERTCYQYNNIRGFNKSIKSKFCFYYLLQKIQLKVDGLVKELSGIKETYRTRSY